MNNRITFYYQKLDVAVSSDDDLQSLIDLHTRSFEKHGWEVVPVDESQARLHPHYSVFNDPNTILSKSVNAWEYTRACYMRWLAYAVVGHPYADFDVINYGFSPADAHRIKDEQTPSCPAFISGVGAMGLLSRTDYDSVIDTYLEFIQNPKIEGPIASDVNDMTIMRHYRPEWYRALPYDDPQFVKDYTGPGWADAVLVHYPHGLTPVPRARTINQVRPPIDC